jgi:uncharacterized protein (DUF433 family)
LLLAAAPLAPSCPDTGRGRSGYYLAVVHHTGHTGIVSAGRRTVCEISAGRFRRRTAKHGIQCVDMTRGEEATMEHPPGMPEVVSEPEIHGGQPVVETRVPIYLILDMLAQGLPPEEWRGGHGAASVYHALDEVESGVRSRNARM